MSHDLLDSNSLAAELARAATAPETRDLYEIQVERLRAYCTDQGLDLFHLSAGDICRFLATVCQLAGGYAVIRMCIAAIGRLYMERGLENPTRHRSVRQLIRGLRRETKIVEARPVLTQEFIRIIQTCGTDLRGLRDRSLLLAAFAGPLRRREVTEIQCDDIVLTGEAIIVLHPRQLMIQCGSEVETCPVAALRTYLNAAHIVSGPVWRGFDKRDKPLPRALSVRSTWQILHDRATAASVSGVSWPGLRFGFIEAGAKLPLFELQKRTLMSDAQALRRQLQRGRAQRRASSEKTDDLRVTADTHQRYVTKKPQQPLPFTWQTVLDVRSDLDRLFSSQRPSRSRERVHQPRPPQKSPRTTFRPEKLAKERRGSGGSGRYTQADILQIRNELTRLYASN